MSASDHRDDFSKQTVRLLAERAAYRCNRPTCRENTILPSCSDSTGSIKTGRAAHIHAAAKGGPRYDENQTSAARKAFDNGIWLCSPCADEIDKDEESFPAALLRSWRQQHDDWLRSGDVVPGLPAIQILTSTGLSTSQMTQGQVITAEMINLFREHQVVVQTTTRHELHSLTLRFQIHEGLHSWESIEAPAGSNLTYRKNVGDWVVHGHGEGAKFTMGAPTLPEGFIFELERLRPNRPLKLRLRTIPPRPANPEFWPDVLQISTLLPYYVTGSFLYDMKSEFSSREFIVPILVKDRVMRGAAVAENLGQPLMEVWHS